ncbi:MAG: hypothetical protein LBU66_01550 [Treponema sp.]|jgi:hypothetical protein|nr:hypothetical protein [Treponema sp.]
MKILYKLIASLALVFLLSGCGAIFPDGYTLRFPKTPDSWVSILGEPHWRVEWLDPGGEKRSRDVAPGKSLKIELPATWANPVTAFPFWSERNLFPGLFMPAGAIFPFDVSGEELLLSWKAGVDAGFYWELAHCVSNDAVNHTGVQNKTKIPANFDWQRFRELFTTDVLSEAVRKDPWLVDWQSVARRTISGNFDRRRLVPQATTPLAIPVPVVPWYGTSPFATPLIFTDDSPVFPVRADTNTGVNIWISNEGLLRVSGKTWAYVPWD